MQKSLAVLFAVVTVAFVAALFVWRPSKPGAATPSAILDGGAVDAAADAATISDAGAAGSPGTSADGGEAAPVAAGDDNGAGSPDAPFPTSDAGVTLLNGSVAPPLAGDAPKSVVFGVILFQYKGAQGAPANARSRDAALELAKQVAVDAKQDFKAALAKGDKGSTENVGRMPRGMIEPAPEFVLFSLAKDGVSDPVDTPRGFWIVHRIE